MAAAVMIMRKNRIDPLAKGIGMLDAEGLPQAWRLLSGEVALPAAVLSETRIAHNLAWMQRFVDSYGLKLAPHGKTTMAPALFRRQIEAGAWGITVATAQQARVAATHGIRCVLIANQVVGASNIAILADLLVDPDIELFCLVDSPAGVAALADGLRPTGRSINVLLELAPTPDQAGYRTGVRTPESQAATLAAIEGAGGHVRLAGVELYEGVLTDEAEIRVYLQRAVAAFVAIARTGAFARTPAILSGAGSAWYDVVAEEFDAAAIDAPADIILRPGCYISHDAGLYRTAQDRILASNPVAAQMRGGLLPALRIWSCVQSIPSPERAVVAMGKRDAAFDAGLPRPVLTFRPGHDATVRATPDDWRVTRMMDQHGFMAISPDDDIRVGDLIGFDISHPCLTFDKWRYLLLVDDEHCCLDVIETYF